MYIIYFWNTGTSERDRGSGRGEEALFEIGAGLGEIFSIKWFQF